MNRFRPRRAKLLLNGLPATTAAAFQREQQERWRRNLERFWAALPEALHDRVERALCAWLDEGDPALGGRGLYAWLNALRIRDGRPPSGLCDPLPVEDRELPGAQRKTPDRHRGQWAINKRQRGWRHEGPSDP